MNKFKRIGAFLLTFVMCLQVMTFSAFAADTSRQDLSADKLVLLLSILKKSGVDFDDVYSENQINETLYIAESGNLYIEITANKNTNALNSLKIALNMSEINNVSLDTIDELDSEQLAKDFAGFSVCLGVFLVVIDPNIDSETVFNELELSNFSSNKEYIYNNIKYTKNMESDILEFVVTPMQQQAQPIIPTPQNNVISVVIDGQPLNTNVAPQSINGRTMVPVRGIFEALGATVVWNPEARQVVATKGDKRVTLTLDSNTAYINGEARTLESPAISYNGSTLVPARFVAEAFGANVAWDSTTKTVNITSVVTETIPIQPEVQEQPEVQPEPEPEPEKTQSVQQAPSTPKGNTVYITKTGKKYHYDSSCNGGTYYPSTLQEAKSRGLTPCNKCAQ